MNGTHLIFLRKIWFIFRAQELLEFWGDCAKWKFDNLYMSKHHMSFMGGLCVFEVLKGWIISWSMNKFGCPRCSFSMFLGLVLVLWFFWFILDEWEYSVKGNYFMASNLVCIFFGHGDLGFLFAGKSIRGLVYQLILAGAFTLVTYLVTLSVAKGSKCLIFHIIYVLALG